MNSSMSLEFLVYVAGYYFIRDSNGFDEFQWQQASVSCSVYRQNADTFDILKEEQEAQQC